MPSPGLSEQVKLELFNSDREHGAMFAKRDFDTWCEKERYAPAQKAELASGVILELLPHFDQGTPQEREARLRRNIQTIVNRGHGLLLYQIFNAALDAPVFKQDLYGKPEEQFTEEDREVDALLLVIDSLTREHAPKQPKANTGGLFTRVLRLGRK